MALIATPLLPGCAGLSLPVPREVTGKDTSVIAVLPIVPFLDQLTDPHLWAKIFPEH